MRPLHSHASYLDSENIHVASFWEQPCLSYYMPDRIGDAIVVTVLVSWIQMLRCLDNCQCLWILRTGMDSQGHYWMEMHLLQLHYQSCLQDLQLASCLSHWCQIDCQMFWVTESFPDTSHHGDFVGECDSSVHHSLWASVEWVWWRWMWEMVDSQEPVLDSVSHSSTCWQVYRWYQRRAISWTANLFGLLQSRILSSSHMCSLLKHPFHFGYSVYWVNVLCCVLLNLKWWVYLQHFANKYNI